MRTKFFPIFILGISILATASIFPIAAKSESNVADDPTVAEIRVDRNGLVSMSGLKVVQIAGNTFYARTTWDQTFIRWIIKTGKDTAVTKRFGDPMTAYEVKEGDYLSLEGHIEGGGSSLIIVATKIVDWSNYEAQSTFSGTVSGTSGMPSSFTLTNKKYGEISVMTSATTTVLRGKREITRRFIRTGDSITSIEGVFNHQQKTLVADKIRIYINPNVFKPQNYQGSLKTAPSLTGVPNFLLSVGGKDYKVVLENNASILNTKRTPVTFDRWLIGDTVRVYGYIREDNDELDTITAEIVRDMNF